MKSLSWWIYLVAFLFIFNYGCESNPPQLMPQDPLSPSSDRGVNLTSEDATSNSIDSSFWDAGTDQAPIETLDQNPSSDQTTSMPIQRCVSPCDCTPGLDCIDGQCIQGEEAIYCCGQSPCPQDALCTTTQNEVSRCGVCTSACDCQLGQACESGVCVGSDLAPLCCTRSPCPVGQACELPAGELSECTEECVSHCDCYAGQACIDNQCVRDPDDPIGQAGYCCENDLCPQDAQCQHPDGSAGVCPATPCTNACDCPGTQACVNGECRQDPEAGLSYCCADSPCPENRTCDLPQGGQSTCPSEPECQTACDCFDGYACVNGQCAFSPDGEIILCCEKDSCLSGLRCQHDDGSFDLCE